MAAMTAMSTLGAMVTAYVCWPKKTSRKLKNLRLIVATGCLVASSVMSAFVSKKLPFISRDSSLPDADLNVQIDLDVPTMGETMISLPALLCII